MDVFRRGTLAVAGLVLVGISMMGLAGVASAEYTVTISGKAYRFNHMDTPLSGAVIKVREFPHLQAIAAENGDYTLEVPDDANVTPYIVSGDYTPGKHYNELDLQTFHTRGENLVNANFQVPSDEEYNFLKLALEVPAGPDGRPLQCAIVTTSSARNVRGVSYEQFWENTPHGVPGATSTTFPAIPGPIYFNEFVIPDRTKTASSEDGGIIWDVVPAGTYRIVTSHPTTRFASFLATCENGRIVNANPPWGAYELSPGEQPLGASDVAANLRATKAIRKGKKFRQVRATVESAEQLSIDLTLKRGGKRLGLKKIKAFAAGKRTVTMAVKRGVKPGKAKLDVTLRDAAGVAFVTTRTVKVPRVIKAKKKKKKNRR